MEFEAVVLPPGLDSESQITDSKDQFLQAEHSLVGAALVGKPLLDDHDPTKVLGTVTGCRMDPVSGKLHITAFIPDDTHEQRRAHERILSGELKDVSMGHQFFDGKTTGVERIVPKEVSVCEEGRRDGTHLHRIRITKNSGLAQRYSRDRFPTTKGITVVASKNKQMSDVDKELEVVKLAEQYKEQVDALQARLAEFEEQKADEEARKQEEATREYQKAAQDMVNLFDDQATRDRVAQHAGQFPVYCSGNPEALAAQKEIFTLVTASMSSQIRAQEQAMKQSALSTSLAALSNPASRFISAPTTVSRVAPVAISTAPQGETVNASKKTADPFNPLIEAIMKSAPISKEAYNSKLFKTYGSF